MNLLLMLMLLCVSSHTHLSLVVNIVEVLPDPRLRALALDVCSGGSGGIVADGQAARGGQASAAAGGSPEEQHGDCAEDMMCLRDKLGTQTARLVR